MIKDTIVSKDKDTIVVSKDIIVYSLWNYNFHVFGGESGWSNIAVSNNFNMQVFN